LDLFGVINIELVAISCSYVTSFHYSQQVALVFIVGPHFVRPMSSLRSSHRTRSNSLVLKHSLVIYIVYTYERGGVLCCPN
jgi:hypothetical protein